MLTYSIYIVLGLYVRVIKPAIHTRSHLQESKPQGDCKNQTDNLKGKKLLKKKLKPEGFAKDC